MHDIVGNILAETRAKATLPFVRGRLLDIGCGRNLLVKKYGNGIGVDANKWDGVDLVIMDSSRLPFNNQEFDSITIIAALNHFPERKLTLVECHRLLRPGGILIITMPYYRIAKLWHLLRKPWDIDQRFRKWVPGEKYALTKKELILLATSSGFSLKLRKKFMVGLNSLYVFEKQGGFNS